MFYKKGKFDNKKSRWQGKKKDKEEGMFYHCKKPGHLIADCPEMKNKASTLMKAFKKRVMKAIRNDS